MVLNFGGTAQRLNLSALSDTAEVLLATEMSDLHTVDLASLELWPNEGLILQLKKAQIF